MILIRNGFINQNGLCNTLLSYRLQKYNQKIHDPNQPLLVSRASARTIRGGGSELILLIPELCRMTGLSETQRNNLELNIFR